MRLEHLGPRLADEGLVLGDEAPRPRAVAAVRGADARGELVDERLLRAVRVREGPEPVAPRRERDLYVRRFG